MGIQPTNGIRLKNHRPASKVKIYSSDSFIDKDSVIARIMRLCQEYSLYGDPSNNSSSNSSRNVVSYNSSKFSHFKTCRTRTLRRSVYPSTTPCNPTRLAEASPLRLSLLLAHHCGYSSPLLSPFSSHKSSGRAMGRPWTSKGSSTHNSDVTNDNNNHNNNDMVCEDSGRRGSLRPYTGRGRGLLAAAWSTVLPTPLNGKTDGSAEGRRIEAAAAGAERDRAFFAVVVSFTYKRPFGFDGDVGVCTFGA